MVSTESRRSPGPPDGLLDELDATTMMLGRLMAARHAEHCEGGMIGGPRLLMLRMLSELGPSRAGDIAAHLGIKAPATTSLIDALERDGLVAREHAPEDRRVTLVSLTDEGQQVMREAERVRRTHMRAYLSVLDDEDIRTLIRIQRTLIDAIVDQDV